MAKRKGKEVEKPEGTGFKLSQLKYNKKNPRKIDQDSLQRLKDKLNEFPKFLSLRPIVYDPLTKEVLGGNQRLKGLRELGYKEVPNSWVKSADELTEEEKDAFIILDNKSDGNWDNDILLENWEAEQLEEWGLDLSEFEVGDTDYGAGADFGGGDEAEDKSQYGVIVKCIDSVEQEKIFNWLIGQGHECKIVVT